MPDKIEGLERQQGLVCAYIEVNPDRMSREFCDGAHGEGSHLTLLARDGHGYASLARLVSTAQLPLHSAWAHCAGLHDK